MHARPQHGPPGGQEERARLREQCGRRACRYGLDEPAIAARLERAVRAALDKGYRTGDIMGEGCTQVSCSKMGEILGEFVSGS